MPDPVTVDVTQGTLIRLAGEWHHSVSFDGFEHVTACGIHDESGDWTVELPPAAVDPTCDDCFPSLDRDEERVAADGGQVTDNSKEAYLVADGPGEDRCDDCGRRITRGPSGTEYGHERGRNGDRDRCPRRPDHVDPGRQGPIHDEWQTSDDDLVTDGGLAPEDDPGACSLCGACLGTGKRIVGDEYCDACQREHGMKPPLRRCIHCGTRAPEERMEEIDVSADDEYYPDIRWLCPNCAGGDSA